MLIQKKRIRTLEKYMPSSFQDKEIFISAPWAGNEPQAKKIGFPNFEEGLSILPAKIGPISRYNSDGKFLIRKDLPKEWYTREFYWTLRDWGGNLHSGVSYITKERYQRELIEPMESYMTLINNNNIGIILSKGIIYNDKNSKEILHIMNLFLEVFGSCSILDENMETYYPTNIVKLNWTLLPQGEYPREDRKAQIQPFLAKLNKGRRILIEERLQLIESFKPDKVGVGLNGFSGYFAFWFPEKNICVLECHEIYNATYVLANNWTILSQLTKSELLQNDLYEQRIIHSQNRESEIKRLLS